MVATIIWLKKRLIAILGLIIFIVAAAIIPWPTVGRSLLGLNLVSISALILLSLVYFLAKAFRFHFILARLGFGISVQQSILIYLGAQPMTFVPGGEFYRTLLFEKHAGIPSPRTSSAVVFQAIIELIALIAITFIAVLATGMFLRQVLVLAAFVLLVVILLNKGWLLKASVINKLPFVHMSQQKVTRFRTDNKVLFQQANFIRLFLLSLIPIVAGVAIVGVTAARLGAKLTIMQVILAYTVPVVVSYVAVIPGFGEGGGIGTLLLFHVALAPAIAVMLLFKLFTQGMGLILGPLGMLWLRLLQHKHKDAHA